MAHLFRLIRAFVVFVLAAGALASAIGQTTTEYRTRSPWKSTWYSSWTTQSAACSELGAVGGDHQGGYPGKTTSAISDDGGRCDVFTPSGNILGSSGFETREGPPGMCLLGMERGADGKCACKAGTHDVGGGCIPNESDDDKKLAAECKAGAASGKGVKVVGNSTGSTPDLACYLSGAQYGVNNPKGCAVTVGDSVAVPNANGSRDWSGIGTYTGSTCVEGTGTGSGGGSGTGGTGDDVKGPRVAENPCPKGFPGTVNGTSVCVPVSSSNGVDSTVKSTSTNPDGSKAEVIEETKCSGGICTTTTTTNNYNSAGASTGTTKAVNTESIAAKCAKTPANKVCTETGTGTGAASGSSSNGDGKGDSSFSGTCANGFKAVSDDAVTNAMAEEQYRRNCEVLAKDSTEAKAVEAASDKDGKTKAENPNDFEVKVGPTNFDQSDALGGGACSLDKTITVAKMQVTLPFNAICNPLAALGQLLVAVSLLGAMVIVTRG